MRGAWVIAATASSLCIAVGTPLAAGGKCQSIEAKCAIAAGGKCDRETGHWCYGISKSGENCGGSPAAFRTCLDRAHGSHASTSAAAGSDTGKCTSVQARCIIEAGGYCNPRTGAWRLGFVYQHYYGGNHQTFMACLDRAMAAGKLKQ